MDQLLATLGKKDKPPHVNNTETKVARAHLEKKFATFLITFERKELINDNQTKDWLQNQILFTLKIF